MTRCLPAFDLQSSAFWRWLQGEGAEYECVFLGYAYFLVPVRGRAAAVNWRRRSLLGSEIWNLQWHSFSCQRQKSFSRRCTRDWLSNQSRCPTCGSLANFALQSFEDRVGSVCPSIFLSSLECAYIIRLYSYLWSFSFLIFSSNIRDPPRISS